ncbi:prepilin peptidase [Rhodoferax saidenbachensis]|uniref:Prepilin leader peptidase/N-methyltransferase n=1 Tax=Rhodoferax saidenbachensis TaxID=1484693 RepID=A0A1P8KD38_9BURK|nr:A24 family peptidase [Rhodoferax saidenbachensis]APW43895.1 prepilin peptidase [Rhodoferax saidenbachensis]
MSVELQWLAASLAGILGLLIGSFLNVVIYRLPKMMERQWAAECAELSGKAQEPEEASFNLMLPRSRCPHCSRQIRWFENIPVISYLALRGKCASCKAPISPRYPLVEIATGALFFFCVWQWGATMTGVAWCVFAAALLALALIDWDTTLLPDDITLPLLWLGLVAASLRWIPVDLNSALWGAIAGYLSLWSVYWAFKLVTGKEGMGYGDFKLFAALGVWFGWQTLIPMILLASVIGAVVGIAMKFASQLREGGYVPFGPFLAGAGLTALIGGPAPLRHFVGL